MDQINLIEKMRARVELCRNLAATTTDPRTAEALRAIADEGEADIERLVRNGTGKNQPDV